VSFYTGTQVETLYSLAASVTKNTYTTEACIGPLVASAPVPKIPADYWTSVPNGVNRAILFKAMGTIATTSAATFQGRFALDTTPNTIVSGNAVTYWPTLAPTAALTSLWDMEVWITAQAVGQAGTTLQINGDFRQSVVATGTLSTAPQNVKFQTSLTSKDNTVPYYVELFGTWSASASGNTTTVQQMFLFGLN
jgi:hypothetical protein